MDQQHVQQQFACQSCKARLVFTVPEGGQPEAAGAGAAGAAASSSGSGSTSAAGAGRVLLGASSLAASRLDESFIVLDDAGRRGLQRAMDESFVMLAGSSSVVRQAPPGGSGGAAGWAGPGGPAHLDAVFASLARAFELASTETKVDQPLCVECQAAVRREVEAASAEAEADIAAYQAALERLAAEDGAALSEAEFAQKLREAEAEEEQERRRAEGLEAELAAAQAEAAGLAAAREELAALEARYWHDFNDAALALRAHCDQRDALLTQVEATQATLERLRRANVYNDVFHIWHDGPFGTISGFRLGKTATAPVDWQEINAAWGQAVLLLHTMAQACKLTFASARLLPMGSYPRLADKKGAADLYGPVNKLYCTSYDRAMTLYLACLKEFADFARKRDETDGKREPFELPYVIDGDKVGGMTIKLMFNKDAKWTKALKYMLTDLKWCLKWMIAYQEGPAAGPAGLPHLAQEPLASSLTM